MEGCLMSTRLKTLEAILHQWAFKPEPMRRMLVAVLQLALRGGGGGESQARSAHSPQTQGEASC
jgi:hypothetical protein